MLSFLWQTHVSVVEIFSRNVTRSPNGISNATSRDKILSLGYGLILSIDVSRTDKKQMCAENEQFGGEQILPYPT